MKCYQATIWKQIAFERKGKAIVRATFIASGQRYDVIYRKGVDNKSVGPIRHCDYSKRFE